MIVPGAQIICPVRVPLELITVAPQTVYYPDVVMRYLEKLTDPARPHDDVLVSLIPCGVGGPPAARVPLFRAVDGRHRFLASVLAGRPNVLALVEIAPEQPSSMETLIIRLMTTYPQERPCDQQARQAARAQQQHGNGNGNGNGNGVRPHVSRVS